jgi:hypothetical protein
LANIRRIWELGFDSIRIRFGRIRISVSEFEFEFGELYTLFQNSDSPNIREYEFEFELGEFFPTPAADSAAISGGLLYGSVHAVWANNVLQKPAIISQ